MDVERVNLVMNVDLPRDTETYFHRIGRTGRFGTYGVAVSFVSNTELSHLRQIQSTYKTTISQLPVVIPPHFYAYQMEEEPAHAALSPPEELLEPDLKRQRRE